MTILEKLNLFKDDLKVEIEFPNGKIIKNAWEDIERFNEVCQSEYNVSLL